MFNAYAKPLPYETPTNNAPTKPGPYVGAITSISSNFTFACSNANFVTLEIASIWFLDAISGTTPPNCSSISLTDCPSCPNNTSNPGFYPFGNIIDCSYDAASTETLTINAQPDEYFLLFIVWFLEGIWKKYRKQKD